MITWLVGFSYYGKKKFIRYRLYLLLAPEFWPVFVQLHHLYPWVGLSSSRGMSMTNDPFRFLFGGIHSFTLRSISAWENVGWSPPEQLGTNKCLVYSNSVLATLNARITIRGLGEDSDELSFSLQTAAKPCRPTLNTSALMVRLRSFGRWSLLTPKIAVYQYFDQDWCNPRAIQRSPRSRLWGEQVNATAVQSGFVSDEDCSLPPAKIPSRMTCSLS